jgi:hypothetical protein
LVADDGEFVVVADAEVEFVVDHFGDPFAVCCVWATFDELVEVHGRFYFFPFCRLLKSWRSLESDLGH